MPFRMGTPWARHAPLTGAMHPTYDVPAGGAFVLRFIERRVTPWYMT